MQSIFSALTRAFAAFWAPRILAFVLLPMLFAAAFWVGLAWWLRDDWVRALEGVRWIAGAASTLGSWGFAWLADSILTILLALLVLPLIQVTALLLTSFLAMPIILDYVGPRDFAHLRRKAANNVAASVGNSAAAAAVYLMLWMVTLPLWLIPPAALALPVMLSAYLNQRLFRFDALAEHADREEYGVLLARAGGRLYLLGVILGLLQFVPLVNFVLPVYSALAYSYFCLDQLSALRGERNGAGTGLN